MSKTDVHFHLLSGTYEGTGGTPRAPRVSLHVPLQPLLGDGTVRALLAREWLFSSVSSHVIPQVSGKVSCVVTVSAFVTPEARTSPSCCHASQPVPALLGTVVHQDLLRMPNLFMCCTLVINKSHNQCQHKAHSRGFVHYCYFLTQYTGPPRHPVLPS